MLHYMLLESRAPRHVAPDLARVVMSGHQRLSDGDVDVNIASGMRGAGHGGDRDAASQPLRTDGDLAPAADTRVFRSLTPPRRSVGSAGSTTPAPVSRQCMCIALVCALVVGLLAVVVVVTEPRSGATAIHRQHLLPSAARKSLPSCGAAEPGSMGETHDTRARCARPCV